MQLIITAGEGSSGPETHIWGFSLHALSYQQQPPRCPPNTLLFPPLGKSAGLCRVPLPALWSGCLSRQRASPAVAWTSFSPSPGITVLHCLMSYVLKTTALCILCVWFWLLWVGGRRANRSLSIPGRPEMGAELECWKLCSPLRGQLCILGSSWEEAAEDKGGIWGRGWEVCQLACFLQNAALVRDLERADIPGPDVG